MKAPLFLAASLFVLFAQTALANPAGGDLLKLESELEAKIEQRLRGILGAGAKAGVSVQLRASRPVGAAGPLQVDGVDVILQVPNDASDATVASAKSIITDGFNRFSPQIIVKKYAVPQTASLGLDGPDFGKSETPALLMPFLAAGACVALGFLILAFTLRQALGNLSDKLRTAGESSNFSPSYSNAMPMQAASAPTSQKEKAGGGDKLDTGASPLPLLARNVKVVKECLKQQPSLLVRELCNMSGAGKGFRWLLLMLSTEEQASLKSYLGEERMTQLSNEASDVSGDASFDAKVQFLDELAERIMLRKVRGNSPVEAALDTETIVAFLLAEPQALVAATEAVNDKGAWRIMAEFLPREEFQRLLASSNAAKWKNIVDATDLAPATIQASAKRMLDSIKNSPNQKASKADRTRYFQSVLLEPILAALGKMSLGQQDELISKLQASASDLIPLIEARIWTPRQLLRVPGEYLADFVKSLPMEQRVALVIGLPPELSDKIISVLPEGNVKIVVQDQVKRIEQKGDERERSRYSEVCRGLLQTLRDKAAKREFRLLRADEVEELGSTVDDSDIADVDAADDQAAA